MRKTSPSSSYCTLASGGYIITIRPMAMGMEVVPMEALWMALPICGQTYPARHADGHGQEDPQGQVAVEK